MVEAGTVLQNRYIISKQIGAGGMGTVYVAIDQRFNSPVAIKETLFDEASLQHAFEREAQLLNSLRHPALPHVIDYFTEGERQYLVMEYFAGEDLSEILKRKRSFPVSDVLRWADDLLDALVYLHSQKTPVVHRDIKPQNLKLTPRGEIILLDFGLAKGKPGDDSQISRANSIFGYSRNYAPLEQIQGAGTDVRSDIYSLGATLYHLLTGKPPVDALTRATTFVNKQADPLVPANALNEQVTISIAQILQQTLELNPELRPQTAMQLRESLQIAAKTILGALDYENTKVHSSNSDSASARAFVHAPSLAEVEKADNSRSIEVPIATTNAVAREPFEQPDLFNSLSASNNHQSSSLGRFVGIAAAILILGGVSVAAWFATSRSSSINTQTANSNSGANLSPKVKSAVQNVNAKTEVKIEERTLNPRSTSSLLESKQSTSKPAAIKTPDIQATGEEAPLPDAPPIVVKSAPPTKDLKQASEEDETEAPVPRRKTEEIQQDETEEPKDKPQKRRKTAELIYEDRGEIIQRRERRAPDRRKKQKLPTLLGAPQ